MRHGAATIIGLFGIVASGSACAMSGEARPKVDCAVTKGEKLLAAVGGASGLCGAISEALSAEAVNVPVKIRVEVRSSSQLTAKIERNGVALPAQNMAVADSKLRPSMVADFARAIARALAKAG